MEDDQQFCLRWNNHQSTLVAVFDTLLEKGNLVDCTLAAEGKFLKAHKVVLSACSPYFEALLSQNYDKHPIFILKDVKFQELKAMMDYMYRGEVNISQDQLGALLKAAESLQIKGLSDNKRGEERRPAPPPPARSPPPGPSLPRVQGLTIEQRKREADDSLSREGSQSPGLRRRKRNRRKSEDNLDNHHELSNSSESHSNQAPAQNIPATIPATKLTNVPEPIETKTEITTPKMNDSTNSQVPNIEKIETHSELIIEPKSEYEEVNEDSIEDLTLDEDDLTNMEDMDEGAGPSHGNVGEGSGQGFSSWHMGNQSQDEVFLAASEAVGANRDAQETLETVKRKLSKLLNYESSSKRPKCSKIVDDTLAIEVIALNHPKKGLRSKTLDDSEEDLRTNPASQHAEYSSIMSVLNIIDKKIMKIDLAVEMMNSSMFNIEKNFAVNKPVRDLLPKLPIETEKEMVMIELSLKNPEVRSALINYLKTVDGSDARNNVFRCLNKVFGLVYATKCSWTGRNNKIKLRHLELVKVIFESCYENHKMTEQQFENAAMDWFRTSQTRLGRTAQRLTL